MKTLFLCGLLFGALSLSAQFDNESALTGIGLKGHKSFIIIHSEDVRSVKETYPWAMELDYFWQFVNNKSWSLCNCFPKIGVSVNYWDYDNPEILGEGLSSLFYVEPYWGARNRIGFSLRAGFGLGYLNSPYDEVEKS